MLRGISFVGDNDVFFSSLPELMDVSAYDWYVDDVELNYFYFRPGRYGSLEFKSALDAFASLSFVRIRRYTVGSAVGGVDTYEEYLKDDCDMLIYHSTQRQLR